MGAHQFFLEEVSFWIFTSPAYKRLVCKKMEGSSSWSFTLMSSLTLKSGKSSAFTNWLRNCFTKQNICLWSVCCIGSSLWYIFTKFSKQGSTPISTSMYAIVFERLLNKAETIKSFLEMLVSPLLETCLWIDVITLSSGWSPQSKKILFNIGAWRFFSLLLNIPP